MTAVAHQLSARRLGASRWRVDLTLDRDRAGQGPTPRPHPQRITLRSCDGSGATARVESVVVAAPSRRDRFSVVIVVDPPQRTGARARFELGGDGWSGELELTARDEPPAPVVSPAPPVPAAVDYRARDYEALRTMLLAVVDASYGGGLADHPVSQTAALVEQIAYVGDALSYRLDAIATEAYLATSRRRISVTRHAALLDYSVSQGRSARVWLRFMVNEPMCLPAGTQVLAGVQGGPSRVQRAALAAAVAGGALVFETLQPVALTPDPPTYFPTAGGKLQARATTAVLAGPCEALHAGMLVVVEPQEGEVVGPGQVVRLTAVRHGVATTHVEWAQADALAADWALTHALRVRAGNLVIADHGETHDWAQLPAPVDGQTYWPQLPAPSAALSAGPCAQAPSAAEMLAASGWSVLPAVKLRDGKAPNQRPWTQRTSLLESGPGDRAYVVEIEDDAPARLRFGDATNGMQPASGASFEVWMRSGGGSQGNVGAGSITTVVSDDRRVLSASNPVAAVGGEDPESLDRVRLFAPRAFRITDRAVTPGDYTAAALAVEGVADAVTVITASGCGPIARVRVFGGHWGADHEALVQRVRQALDRRRPVGVALDVAAATPMPVTVGLNVTVQANWSLAAMSTALEGVLSDALLGPGHFGFGTRLHRSDLIGLLVPVAGATDVTITQFNWTGREPGPSPSETLQAPFGHIIRIDDKVSMAARGSISFQMSASA